MHRIKGLDFDHVIIASMIEGTVPLEISEKSNEKQIEDEKLLKEKSLLITSYGVKSTLIK